MCTWKCTCSSRLSLWYPLGDESIWIYQFYKPKNDCIHQNHQICFIYQRIDKSKALEKFSVDVCPMWFQGPIAQLFYRKEHILSQDTWWSWVVLFIQWWHKTIEALEELRAEKILARHLFLECLSQVPTKQIVLSSPMDIYVFYFISLFFKKLSHNVFH